MPACDGLRFEHVLRFATADDSTCGLLHQLVLRILKGQVPAEIRPFLFGARLIAAPKPGESEAPAEVAKTAEQEAAEAEAAQEGGTHTKKKSSEGASLFVFFQRL